MKILNSVFALILATGLMSGVQAVEVEQALIDEFNQVQGLCKSSLSYDLNEPIDEVSVRYHDQMQCLFGTATRGYIEENRTFFSQKLQDVRSDYELAEVPAEPEGCETNFDSIVSQQEEQGYQSLCEASGPNAAKDYSLCRVSETAFNEFCAYQEYIHMKSREEVMIRQCSDASQLSERTSCISGEQAKLEEDLSKTLDTIEGTLEKYETFIQSQTLHNWFLVLTETLENTFRRLNMARMGIEKWPLKFHDAASQSASSSTATQ